MSTPSTFRCRAPVLGLLNPFFVSSLVPEASFFNINIYGTRVLLSLKNFDTFAIDFAVFLTLTEVKDNKSLSAKDKQFFLETKRRGVDFLLKDKIKLVPLQKSSDTLKHSR